MAAIASPSRRAGHIILSTRFVAENARPTETKSVREKEGMKKRRDELTTHPFFFRLRLLFLFDDGEVRRRRKRLRRDAVANADRDLIFAGAELVRAEELGQGQSLTGIAQ